MSSETFTHWRIFHVDSALITEEYVFECHIQMRLPDAYASFVQQYEWLRPHHATPDGRMILSFQCFVIRTRGKTCMIDTCIGADRKREFDVFTNMKTTFLEDLELAGYPAAKMDAVMCTHLHFDHVGWNTRLVDGKWVPTFPQARYLFGREEFAHWKQLRETGGYHHMDHLEDSIDPIVNAGLMELIGPEFQLTDEVSLIPTPGHTPGHMSVLIRSAGKEAVITGDMMHHPIQLAVPDTPANFDMDKPRGVQTRMEFIKRFANQPTLVIGSHFADPTSGHIVSDGKAWKLT